MTLRQLLATGPCASSPADTAPLPLRIRALA